jgi:AmmeMemoRadiSam system protein A
MSGRAMTGSASEPRPDGSGLSPGARQRLLARARAAIAAELGGAPMDDEDLGELRAELERRSGAFVTLARRADGELRGCVGLPEPIYPLAETVARAAVAAALYDRRFHPVAAAELPGLSLHVSVLGDLQPIAAGEIEVGRHGLVVRHRGRSGLLLPQVASDRGWDRLRLLDETCRKAGLPPGTWREPGCELLAFTAVVFGEEG